MAADTKQQILDYLENRGSSTSKQLGVRLGISRQALNVHLRALIDAGKIYKSGSTRAAVYYPFDSAPAARTYNKTLALAGLDESRVYAQVAAVLNLGSALAANQQTIVNYAFTKMLNNAIDHSESERCRISATLDAANVGFEIRDQGIGVFRSIESKLGLEDEHAAMIELLKGKTTTMPEAHSGEGIFFTAQAADRLTLRSHRIELTWDRRKRDTFVAQGRHLAGTLVAFSLNRLSRTKLEDVFARFAPGEYDFEFSKTKIMVKLLRAEYVSRAEAKRLVVNLEKFREIDFDFSNVRAVGQGFVDEVFRVFQLRNPGIVINAIHASAAVDAMIRHVVASSGTA